MSSFTPAQQQEIADLIRRGTEQHDVLIRQLQEPPEPSILYDYGISSVVFAAAFSPVYTVTHTLTVIPAIVLITSLNFADVQYATSNYTASAFDVQGFSPTPGITGSYSFRWLAVF